MKNLKSFLKEANPPEMDTPRWAKNYKFDKKLSGSFDQMLKKLPKNQFRSYEDMLSAKAMFQDSVAQGTKPEIAFRNTIKQFDMYRGL
jgi:hypothetical protein